MNIQVRKFYELVDMGGSIDWYSYYQQLSKQFANYKTAHPYSETDMNEARIKAFSAARAQTGVSHGDIDLVFTNPIEYIKSLKQ